MKIKKYVARTEPDAIEKIKNELGLEALILNIKKTQPKGFFSFLRKPLVEVMAAYDDKKSSLEQFNGITKKNEVQEKTLIDYDKETKDIFVKEALERQKEKIKILEKKLNNTEEMLEKAISQISVAKHIQHNFDRKYENSLVQLFYDALVEQGVIMEIVEELLQDVANFEKEEQIDLSVIVKIVYNKIINILGEPEIFNIENATKGKPIIITFIGPTGVGKTTTIAKLSSLFVLSFNKAVGLITADTYRVAAVEQLKTYAEILGIEIGIAYNKDDLNNNIKKLSKSKEIILVDTAGRSHKNKENIEELKVLISGIKNSHKYLVLSTTTKYEDLLSIVKVYSDMTDIRIIFTKLDETTCLGSILNICYLTGKKISYVTTGQNVPDDIEMSQPEKIAKALMGLGGIAS